MKKNKWDTQLRKGTLELVILAVLRERELYGLEILETLKKEAGFLIPSGTIYPLLDRMKREGLLSSRWVHSEEDRPRKYYKLTKKGQGRFKDLKDNWAIFTRDIEKVLSKQSPAKR
ncbi:MAG: PadR family transcriptional regulator [Alphaproteobacteria bacterium]